MSDAPEIPRPSRMQHPEHLYSAALAVVAPFGFLAGLWPLADRDALFLAIGSLLAAILGLGAYLRNRVIGGVAATLLFSGPWGTLSLLGGPYLVLAFYLLFRLSRGNTDVARRNRIARQTAKAGGAPLAPRSTAAKRKPVPKRVTPPGTQPRGKRF